MPKGVEHDTIAASLGELSVVIPSVMPKGVEHDRAPMACGWRIRKRDSVSDAERR